MTTICPYVRNSWYVAAWSTEVKDRPLGRKILDQPLVVYRLNDGSVAALEDRCPHRYLPLSLGKCVGEHLQCGYHGLKFDRTGTCVEVPSQSLIPRAARVKAFPVQEKFGWIWVWMGDWQRADAALIPNFFQLAAPDFAAVGKTNYVKASYKLLIDNLMDLSHVGFVHTTTIGNAGMGQKGKLSTRKSETGVNVTRYVPDVPPPPTYVKTGVLPLGKNIDRWQIIDYTAPCFVSIHVGGAEAGSGALEGRYEHGLNLWILNAMTPETATTTHYFWASARRYALGDADVDKLLLDQVSKAFDEDKFVLEEQQAAHPNVDEDAWPVGLQSDAGSIMARRLLEKFLARDANEGID